MRLFIVVFLPFFFLIKGPLLVLLPRVAETRWKRGGEPGSTGRGYLHNIPFIHRTKQTSTESLLRLEVGSMGKGGNRLQVGVSLKKIQALSKTGVPGVGRTWSASTQEESEDQKLFGKARTVRGGGRRKVQGVGGCLATG